MSVRLLMKAPRMQSRVQAVMRTFSDCVPRHLAALGSVALIGLSSAGCSTASQHCTMIGGPDGMHLIIPAALYVETGSVSFELCDGELCASAVKELGNLPGDAGPTVRGSTATFSDLGHEFGPGPVDVSVELRDASGSLVAAREERVELKRSHPNGKECDGDGFVGGGLELEAADAR